METDQSHEPWNKGKLVGQKAPLKLKDIWAIRIHLQLENRVRDLALFNLAIDSKLRGCDLVFLCAPPAAALVLFFASSSFFFFALVLLSADRRRRCNWGLRRTGLRLKRSCPGARCIT